MCSEINPTNPLTLSQFSNRIKPNFGHKSVIAFSSYNPSNQTTTTNEPNGSRKTDGFFNVSFKTLGAGKLGISKYPDFEYDPRGGSGTGTGKKVGSEEVYVSFDIDSLYIPPLTSTTTKFLGLPLPPFLRIDIVPEVFQGSISPESGKVALEFTAKFCFSAGSFYRAPPLLVKTVLTSEESRGETKSGRGERMDGDGKCKLVGVAAVDPVDDLFINTFLGLPAECLADLNAFISLSSSS